MILVSTVQFEYSMDWEVNQDRTVPREIWKKYDRIREFRASMNSKESQRGLLARVV
jgi:hypothetical protein